jgi:hypothetical protein
MSNARLADHLADAAWNGEVDRTRRYLNGNKFTSEQLGLALDMATRTNRKGVVNLLLRQENIGPAQLGGAVAEAAMQGNESLAIKFLDRGAKPDALALLWSAINGLTPVYDRLVAQGIRLPQNKVFYTFRATAIHGHVDILSRMVRSGARANEHASLALDDAPNARVANFLISQGADPNARRGQPFIEACSRGRIGVVRTLIEHGADSMALKSRALVEVRKTMREFNLDDKPQSGQAKVVQLLSSLPAC